MMEVLESLKGQLIVSCQAEGADPFNTPENVALFAVAAEMGGAGAIRSEGIAKIRSIMSKVDLPVIGLVKSKFEDGYVRITGSMKDVDDLMECGCQILAIDGTSRLREGCTGPEFIRNVKAKYTQAVILADIATATEAYNCIAAGADCVSTTLSGYTPETKDRKWVDFALIRELSERAEVPVFAEGKINTPELAAQAMKCGAYAVIVGTAITRPRVITQWFVESINSKEI